MNTFFLPLYLLIFLFVLYVLSKDDFLFLKKNISLEQVFNCAFLVAFVGLFFARLFYVLFHFSLNYLNPLVFFVIPYFPGLSLSGGVVGAALFAYLYCKTKKIPLGRVFDFFAVSSLSVLCSGFLIDGVWQWWHTKHLVVEPLVTAIVYTLLFFVFVFVVLPYQKRGELKDGSVALMFFSLFSLVSFLLSLLVYKQPIISLILGEGLLLVLLLIASSVFFIRQENIGHIVRTVLPKRGEQ